MAMESGGPTQTHILPTAAAGMLPINTVGAPGETIGPPTWGTGPDDIGHTCMSVMREAGFPMIKLLLPCRFRRERYRDLGLKSVCNNFR
jgi:hypothetical protein